MAIPAKEIEKQFNTWITKFTYAAIEDIRTEWAFPDRYPKTKYQYFGYTSVTKQPKLTPIVQFSNEAQQICTELFNKLITNLRDIDITAEDTNGTLLQKLTEVDDEQFAKFMFDLGIKVNNDGGIGLGSNLTGVYDAHEYFRGRIQLMLPAHRDKLQISMIAQMFNYFLKAVSVLIARQLWYDLKKVTGNYFLAMLASRGMNITMLDTLQGAIKPKPPKAAKTVATKTVTDTNVVAAVATTNVVPTDTTIAPTDTITEATLSNSDVDMINSLDI